MCVSVAVYADDLIESEEDFLVRLALVSPSEGSFLSLGNNETVVELLDSDCKCHVRSSSNNHQKFRFLYTAVVFTLPSLEAFSEDNSTVMVCPTMSTIPPGASLAIDVVVSLLTSNNTGKSCFFFNCTIAIMLLF